jgi:23S rRNA (pseudouridine1915-N3)-methyltransferase
MKLTVLAVGKVKERFTREWMDEFLKRLTKYCRLEVEELKEGGVEQEGTALLKRIRNDDYVIALDIRGTSMTSESFAQLLKQKTMEQHVVFVIGGADGLSASVLKRANTRLSFGLMTFTHQLARVLLLEQVYRAYTLLAGEKYHH